MLPIEHLTGTECARFTVGPLDYQTVLLCFTSRPGPEGPRHRETEERPVIPRHRGIYLNKPQPPTVNQFRGIYLNQLQPRTSNQKPAMFSRRDRPVAEF